MVDPITGQQHPQAGKSPPPDLNKLSASELGDMFGIDLASTPAETPISQTTPEPASPVNSQPSAAESVAGEAEKGAGLGSLFGPEGLAVGAAVGAGYGVYRAAQPPKSGIGAYMAGGSGGGGGGGDGGMGASGAAVLAALNKLAAIRSRM